jgi:uncharacterized protein DUF4157
MPARALLQRRCACGGTPGPDGECAACKARRLQRSSLGLGPQTAPPIVHEVLGRSGRPLDPGVRGEMEARFGHDFSRVRVHTDDRAAASARAVDAEAYTVGRNVVFGRERYAPASPRGNSLLAHELAHVVQQRGVDASGGPIPVGRSDDPAEQEADRRAAPQPATARPVVRREPTFPDSTCDHVKSNIERAWPTAKDWVSHARRQLATPTDVAGALGTHFKLDPNDSAQAADLSYIQAVYARMEEIFDRQVPMVCTPPDKDDECHLADGREYGAFVSGGRFQITYCTTAADHGIFMGQDLIALTVHEVSHLADSASTDWAYRHKMVRTTYGKMTRAQAIVNAESYAELARDLYLGTTPRAIPMIFGIGTGVLLSGVQPRWVVTASEDVRSRTGLEVFDLVAGIHGFVTVAGNEPAGRPQSGPVFGAAVDLGVISRSADTKLFLDTRIGAYVEDDPRASGGSAGVSARALIGWASGGFRAGVDTRLLFDALNSNHAMLIGVELGYTP